MLAQEIGDRVLPLEVTGRNGRPEAIVMEQARPAFGRTVTDRDELAAALGLDRGDLLDEVQVSGRRVRIGGASVVVAGGVLTV